MHHFIQRHAEQIVEVLNGWDVLTVKSASIVNALLAAQRTNPQTLTKLAG